MISVKPHHPYIQKLVVYGKNKHSNAEVSMFEDILQGKVGKTNNVSIVLVLWIKSIKMIDVNKKKDKK